jgi:hypothetical protein
VATLNHRAIRYVDQPFRELGDRNFQVSLTDYHVLEAQGVAELWLTEKWENLFFEKGVGLAK